MSKENNNSVFTLLEATPVSLRLFIITEAIKMPYSIYRGHLTLKEVPAELAVDYAVLKFAEILEPFFSKL